MIKDDWSRYPHLHSWTFFLNCGFSLKITCGDMPQRHWKKWSNPPGFMREIQRFLLHFYSDSDLREPRRVGHFMHSINELRLQSHKVIWLIKKLECLSINPKKSIFLCIKIQKKTSIRHLSIFIKIHIIFELN